MKIENIFLIRKDLIDRLFLFRKIDIDRFLTLQKVDVVRWVFYFGMLIVYYASMTPWFLWRIYAYFPLFAFFPIVLSMLLSRGLSTPLFNRKDYIYPTVAYFFLLLAVIVVNGRNAFAYIFMVFNLTIFMSVFMLNIDELDRLGTFLAKSMGCLLAVSIPFYILYLIGFPIPHYHLVNPDFDYSYENYRFFLVDDRSTFELVPRFHSVFLEPSHLGMACISLLFAQIGRWKKWYNIVLFTALILTFSLAAYLFLVVMLFSASWMKGKAIFSKLVILAALFTAAATASIFYNKGDNLVNRLIIQRLVINEDGKLEGDNRVSSLFEKEYDQMASSSEILVGRGSEAMKKFGSGNAGYRVYLYCNGLITVFVLIIFFAVVVSTSRNTKAKIVMLLVHALSFIPHAVPTKQSFFIPLYILLFINMKQSETKQLEYKEI